MSPALRPGSVRVRVLVISMKTATERRRTFVHAAPEDDRWAFFDAHTSLHPDLIYDADDIRRTHGRALTAGELGCYSSHFAIWTDLAAQDDVDAVIVLEDDVIADWIFLEKLAQSDLSGIDYLRLYQKRPTRFRVLRQGFIERTKSLVRQYGFAFGTQGYYISKTGAAAMIEATRHVTAPIDDIMDRSWQHGIATHCIFPFPLIERSVPSDIGAERFANDRRAAGNLRYRLNRQANKLRYYVGLAKFVAGK